MWHDFQLLPGAGGTWLGKLILFFLGCSFAPDPEDQDSCELWHNVDLLVFRLFDFKFLPKNLQIAKLPALTVLLDPGKSESTSFVPLFQGYL